MANRETAANGGRNRRESIKRVGPTAAARAASQSLLKTETRKTHGRGSEAKVRFF